MTKEIGELANKWTNNRYRTPNSHPDGGMDSKEFFELLKNDIYSLVKQECISFAEWINGEMYECFLHTDEDIKFWHDIDGSGNYTTEELYTLYKEQSLK